VLVNGPAEELVTPAARARAEALDLEPWAGDARDRYVRIRVHAISGRRITAPVRR
jgi:hypothetical protein